MTDIIGPNDRQPLFKRSYEASVLVNILGEMTQGEQLSYQFLSKKAGFRVEGKTPALATARRILLSDKGMNFEAVYGVGLKRLTDPEIVKAGSRGTQSLSRKATREGDKLRNADFAILSNPEKLRCAALQSVFGAISLMASAPSVTKIENGCSGASRELPIAETLAFFQR
jgi:hypothetical protein